ncbi:MAG: twin-arginine translocation signal domain-containing protein, partial [Alphaproteobacteria bacterium]
MSKQKSMIDRRSLLKAGALAGAAGATGVGAAAPALADEPKAGWTNWSGGQSSNPTALPRPTSEAELIKAVLDGPAPIRAAGAGHSFSPLVPSDGTVLSLSDLTGVI